MADTPKIRFKGFTDDWEWRKLGEVATFINGRAYSQDELLCSGKYKVLRVGNFYTNDSWYYSDMELDDKYYAEEGDLLYTWSATFGPHIWHGDKVIYHYHIWKIELSEHLEKKFALQLLEKDKATILSDKNGSAMVHITKTGMEEKSVLLPTNIEEQSKIGMCLDSIDHLITFHQRKCDAAKVLKKYMLQKMFPRNGRKVPEIRFAGFAGDWEQRKLGAIFKERTERATGDEELLSVTIGNGVIRQADSVKRNIASEDKSNYKIVRKGDVPYNSMRMWQGAVGNSEYDGIVSPAYTVLVPTAQANGKFFMELFKKESTLKIFQRWSQGLTSDTWNLKYPVLSSIEFYVPSIEEQTKIAENFKSLDNLITLYQRKCDELVKIKKYMLQNMFV